MSLEQIFTGLVIACIVVIFAGLLVHIREQEMEGGYDDTGDRNERRDSVQDVKGNSEKARSEM